MNGSQYKSMILYPYIFASWVIVYLYLFGIEAAKTIYIWGLMIIIAGSLISLLTDLSINSIAIQTVTLLFIIYFVINVVRHRRNKKQFTIKCADLMFPLLLLAVNTCIEYYSYPKSFDEPFFILEMKRVINFEKGKIDVIDAKYITSSVLLAKAFVLKFTDNIYSSMVMVYWNTIIALLIFAKHDLNVKIDNSLFVIAFHYIMPVAFLNTVYLDGVFSVLFALIVVQLVNNDSGYKVAMTVFPLLLIYSMQKANAHYYLIIILIAFIFLQHARSQSKLIIYIYFALACTSVALIAVSVKSIIYKYTAAISLPQASLNLAVQVHQEDNSNPFIFYLSEKVRNLIISARSFDDILTHLQNIYISIIESTSISAPSFLLILLSITIFVFFSLLQRMSLEFHTHLKMLAYLNLFLIITFFIFIESAMYLQFSLSEYRMGASFERYYLHILPFIFISFLKFLDLILRFRVDHRLQRN